MDCLVPRRKDRLVVRVSDRGLDWLYQPVAPQRVVPLVAHRLPALRRLHWLMVRVPARGLDGLYQPVAPLVSLHRLL